MQTIEEWITQVEFCRRLGITKQALQQAEKRERVIIEKRNGRRRMEYHSNRRRFVESARVPMRYTQQSISNRAVKHKKNGRQMSGTESRNGNSGTGHKEDPFDLIEDPPDADGDFRPNMTRLEAEAIKQVYLAKQAKLRFLQGSAILIESAVVKREWESIAIRVQKAMLSIPDRVAELFASYADSNKIHQELTAEIRHALSSLQYRVEIEEDSHDRIEEIVEREDDIPQEDETQGSAE